MALNASPPGGVRWSNRYPCAASTHLRLYRAHRARRATAIAPVANSKNVAGSGTGLGSKK